MTNAISKMFAPLTAVMVTVVASGNLAAAEQAPGTVKVFAAASTVDALEEVRDVFKRQNPKITVELSFEASSTAAKQIESGASADLFISASHDWAEYLAKRKLVAAQVDLLGNQLVVIVGKESALKITQLKDLASSDVAKLALANPDSVPAGIYARHALEKSKLWDSMQSKYAGASNVRQAVQFVETGAAEAGIVYKTDALASNKLRIALEIDTRLSDPIRYPLVLLKQAEGNSAAKSFYDYLQSEPATRTFEKHGFLAGKVLKQDKR